MTSLEALVWYATTGVVAGTLAGLLGVGGGLVIVPTLLWIFAERGFGPSVSTQLAIGTSLAVIVFSAVSSVSAHHARGAVEWRLVARLAGGIVVGAALGAWLATLVDGRRLLYLYVAFVVLAGIQIFVGGEVKARRREPSRAVLVLAGAVIGGVSSLFGIGGGTLTVPFLLWCGRDVRHVVGTAAACGLPIATSGAVTFATVGYGNASLPEHSVGFVHMPALVAIAMSSVLMARVGARWAHTIPRARLRRIFAVVLWVVAGKIALGF